MQNEKTTGMLRKVCAGMQTITISVSGLTISATVDLPALFFPD